MARAGRVQPGADRRDRRRDGGRRDRAGGAFARLAVEETGYGVVADKIQKNLFASQKVYEFIRPMKTVGVVARHEDRRVVEIAEPFGVVAAIVPSTNPTSTAIYKILIALKARCAIVLSPHPAAVKCITRVAEVMDEAARRAGAPDRRDQLDDDRHARRHAGADEAARRRGHPGDRRHGTGARRLQRRQAGLRRRARATRRRYIERTADVKKAVRDIITGKTFDNGVLCSSENSVVVDEPIAEEVKREFEAQGGYFMNKAEMDAARAGARDAAAAAQSGARRQVGDGHRGEVRHHRAGGHAGADCAARRRRPRLPAVDREALPGPLLLRRAATGGRGASAASRFCGTAGWDTRCPSIRRTSRSSWSSG